jgi:hypothetical protein
MTKKQFHFNMLASLALISNANNKGGGWLAEWSFHKLSTFNNNNTELLKLVSGLNILPSWVIL